MNTILSRKAETTKEQALWTSLSDITWAVMEICPVERPVLF